MRQRHTRCGYGAHTDIPQVQCRAVGTYYRRGVSKMFSVPRRGLKYGVVKVVGNPFQWECPLWSQYYSSVPGDQFQRYEILVYSAPRFQQFRLISANRSRIWVNRPFFWRRVGVPCMSHLHGKYNFRNVRYRSTVRTINRTAP